MNSVKKGRSLAAALSFLQFPREKRLRRSDLCVEPGQASADQLLPYCVLLRCFLRSPGFRSFLLSLRARGPPLARRLALRSSSHFLPSVPRIPHALAFDRARLPADEISLAKRAENTSAPQTFVLPLPLPPLTLSLSLSLSLFSSPAHPDSAKSG